MTDPERTPELSVVIPIYNERPTVAKILQAVHAVPISKEVIVIDDASTDGTAQLLEEELRPQIDVLIRHYENQGKGAAVRAGIARARGRYLIVQDADLEYDPAQFPKLLKPLQDGVADVVFGSRFLGGDTHRVLFYWHSVGNRVLTALCNMFADLNLSDMETCYKAFRTEIVQSLRLRENRFGFEPEVTLKMSRIPRIRVYEVGITYFGRTYEEGKKINWRDGVSAVFCIFKYGLLRIT